MSDKHERVFLSYSHSGDELRNRLLTALHLPQPCHNEAEATSPMLASDRNISFYDQIRRNIETNLAEALWQFADEEILIDASGRLTPKQAAEEVRDSLLKGMSSPSKFSAESEENTARWSSEIDTPVGNSFGYSDSSTEEQLAQLHSRDFCTNDVFPEHPEIDFREVREWFVSEEQAPDDDGTSESVLLHSIPFFLLHRALRSPIETISPSDQGDRTERIQLPRTIGQFELVEKLGSGGFGVTYLARDTTSFLGRRVVLKIPKRQSLSEIWTRRLLSEAKIWKCLSDHDPEHILQFEDVRRVGPLTFFVTEYMDGGNILNALNERSLDSRRVLVIRLLEKLCEGLDVVHRNGFAHGDIKPQNILVTRDFEKLKVCDFGVSTPMNALTDDAILYAGTPAYLAPESREFGITKQGDIYSLGVTLWELLTGRLPTHSVNALDVPNPALSDPETQHLFATLPDWVHELVVRCLAPKCEDRFRDAAEVLRQVRSYFRPNLQPEAILAARFFPELHAINYRLEIDGIERFLAWTGGISRVLIKGTAALSDKTGQLLLANAREGEVVDLDRDKWKFLNTEWGDAAHFIFGSNLSKELATLAPSTTLRLAYDHDLSPIPWEMLPVGGIPLCLRLSVSRWPEPVPTHSMAVSLRTGRRIRVLVIANTSGDLPGAAEEGICIQREFARSLLGNRLELRVADETAGILELRSLMRSCDILHFAGHGIVAPSAVDGGDVGWLIKGTPASMSEADILRARTLNTLWCDRAPTLVFANACVGGPRDERHRQVSPMAHELLKVGVRSVIGACWAPPDTAATIDFATTFYRHLLAGESVGRAIQTARTHSLERFGKMNLTWAQYVLYGDPTTQVKL